MALKRKLRGYLQVPTSPQNKVIFHFINQVQCRLFHGSKMADLTMTSLPKVFEVIHFLVIVYVDVFSTMEPKSAELENIILISIN